MRDDDDLAVALCELPQYFCRIIRTAVIDEDDFVIDAEFFERRREALVHLRHSGSITVAGDDRTDLRLSRAHRVNRTGSLDRSRSDAARRTAAAIDRQSIPCSRLR